MLRVRPRNTRALLAVLALALVGCGLWLGARGVLARRQLQVARAAATLASGHIRAGELDQAAHQVDEARRAAARADALTSDLVWRVTARTPVVGRTVSAVRAVTGGADLLASRALPGVLAAAREVDAATAGEGSSIRLEHLRAAIAPTTRAHNAAVAGLEGVSRRESWVLPPVASARDSLAQELRTLTRDLGVLVPALEVAPTMLGESSPQTYFLAFQTLAELRATGGLIGAFGVIVADRGEVRLRQVGKLADLRNAASPVLDLGPDFHQRYGAFSAAAFWPNINVSPHFPHTDRIVRELWRRQFDEQLAGTIAVDSVALSHLLRATGPMTLKSGEMVTAENVVDVSTRDAYLRFADEANQNAFSLEIAEAASNKLLAGLQSPIETLIALGTAAREGHVRIGSADAEVQRELERGSVGGTLVETSGPSIGVALNNAGGTKLDYYLRGGLDYALDRDAATATVRLRLTNTVPPSRLPRIGGTSIGGRAPEDPPSPPGRNRTHISIFVGQGASLLGADVDGVEFVREESLPGQPWILGDTRTILDETAERGHRVWSTFLDLDPGREVTLTLNLREPHTDGPIRVHEPPMATRLEVAVRD